MRILTILLLLIAGGIAVRGQEPIAKPQRTEDLVNSGFSRTIPNSAVFIKVGGSFAPGKAGSGFLLLKREEKGPEDVAKPCRSSNEKPADPSATVPCRVLLITNKHVLPGIGNHSAVFLKIGNFGREMTVKEIEIKVLDDIGRYASNVTPHPVYDIAAVDITADLDRNGLTSFSILPTSILGVGSKPPRGLRALPPVLGDSVFILGYPSGIYNPKNVYPILRTGIIATDPKIQFEIDPTLRQKFGWPEKINGFLIDAPIFPGSSGSLVLRKPINYEFAYAPYAIGIISDSIPIQDTDLNSVQRLGLAIVYTADAISETIALIK